MARAGLLRSSCTTSRTSAANGDFPCRKIRSATPPIAPKRNSTLPDSSFNGLPTKGTVLLAHTVPPERGDTLFVDCRAACRRASVRTEGTRAWRRRGTLLPLEDPRSRWILRDRGYETRDAARPAQRRARRSRVAAARAVHRRAREHSVVGWPREEGEAFLAELESLRHAAAVCVHPSVERGRPG